MRIHLVMSSNYKDFIFDVHRDDPVMQEACALTNAIETHDFDPEFCTLNVDRMRHHHLIITWDSDLMDVFNSDRIYVQILDKEEVLPQPDIFTTLNLDFVFRIHYESFILSLRNLRYVALHGYEIICDINILERIIENNPCIEHLFLEGDDISATTIKSTINILKRNLLRAFELKINILEPIDNNALREIYSDLAEVIRTNNVLQHLTIELFTHSDSEQNMEILCEALKENTSIEYFKTQYLWPGYKPFIELVRKNRTLKVLHLDANGNNGSSDEDLIEALKHNISLQSITFNNNMPRQHSCLLMNIILDVVNHNPRIVEINTDMVSINCESLLEENRRFLMNQQQKNMLQVKNKGSHLVTENYVERCLI